MFIKIPNLERGILAATASTVFGFSFWLNRVNIIQPVPEKNQLCVYIVRSEYKQISHISGRLPHIDIF